MVLQRDLREALRRKGASAEVATIVTEVEVDGEKTVLGALTDSVPEVIDLDADQIVPPPRMGTRIDTGVIRGMGKRDDHFLIILDIDRVFSGADVHAVMPEATPEIQA